TIFLFFYISYISEICGYNGLAQLLSYSEISQVQKNQRFSFLMLKWQFQEKCKTGKNNITTEEVTADHISIYSYKVQSTITSRFAHTVICSKVVNRAAVAQSVAFNVQIPKTAFISNFTMNVNGLTFVGSVKARTEARSLYARARARGRAVGIIRTSAYDMENFKGEVSVPAGSKIYFELHYEQVMRRKLGVYEQLIFLQPGKLVQNLQVDVYIFEPKGISFVEVPNLLGSKFDNLTHITRGELKAHVSFKPTLSQQRECENCSTTAVNGNFVVRYDVKREANVGELQISNGYFVHFFAPTNLPPLPKNIIFVIDVSGSMWGLKMKQTIRAMQTILEDLRPDDHFTVIDFNHNVRCWSDELVLATSLQIEEAKEYIKAIHPSGGTNINEALLRAIHILTEASNFGLLDPHSVSLIILLSDGDPTVGEIKLSVIQKNVKRYMQETFSLFSLGIGFDVDFDFLERISLENRGTAQRIYANQDASVQLRNFYKQVSTPLLRSIEVNYPKDSVVEVTQNSFDKYFSGSELVVAGRVVSNTVQFLESVVTAKSAHMDYNLIALEEVTKLDEVLSQQKFVNIDFSRQMWAFLMINQLLAERSLASSAAKKRSITKKIMDLAVNHQLVTPLTAMLVESEDGKEILLADSPKDPKIGCCPGAGYLGTRVPQVNKVPLWVSEHMNTTSATHTGPESSIVLTKSLPLFYFLVDDDPHFIIHLPKSQHDVCFNIDSEPGRILNLVSDPDTGGTGVVVNGQLIGAKNHDENKKLRTYFGAIGIYLSKQNVKVEVTTERIILKRGRHYSFIPWAETGIMNLSVTITVNKESNITVTVNKEMSFFVLLHRVWKKHPLNVDFLGIYIPPSNKFSLNVHGLIGQFMNEPEVIVSNVRPGPDVQKPQATMEVKGQKLTVTRGWQKDFRKDTVHGSNVYCWFVHNSGKGFIDGHYKDYFVPDLYSFLTHP
uniref:Inter-alpha-trypsin inhibitor heavy chain 2 n=1 Tax=Latimeria chalumnae TaxID=7897 RepID=H3AMP0_LATCH